MGSPQHILPTDLEVLHRQMELDVAVERISTPGGSLEWAATVPPFGDRPCGSLRVRRIAPLTPQTQGHPNLAGDHRTQSLLESEFILSVVKFSRVYTETDFPAGHPDDGAGNPFTIILVSKVIGTDFLVG
jgi:hypothetical protein